MSAPQVSPPPQTHEVLLRDDNAFFYRREPVALRLLPGGTHLTLAGRTLPLRQVDVAHGLGRGELVLTLPRGVLTIRPTAASAPQWGALSRALGLRAAPEPAAPRYTLHEELGRGAFGVVRRASAPDGATVAVKRVPKKRVRASPAALAAARRELAVARRLPPHPALVRVVEARETRADFLVVTELVPGGTLLHYLRTHRPSPRVVAHIMHQILGAVSHLHSHGIVHRDVKLENLLVVDPDADLPTVKLCDFGLAIDERAIAAPRPGSGAVGTGYAQAPEMVLTESECGLAGYGRAVDVWACGIVLFSMLYRRVPWLEDDKARSRQMSAMLDLSSRGEPSIQVVQRVDERLRTPQYMHSLLCGLLQPDARKRLSARAALEHRVFTAHEEEQDMPSTPRGKSFHSVESGSPRSLRQAATDVMSLLRVADTLQTRACSADDVRGLMVV